MKYKNIREGVFLSRPNRFIAHVEINGKEEVCHVKNTGRLKELLIPGTKVYVEESDNPNRKTKYDLIQLYKNDILINIDSQMPNYLVREWIEKGGVFPGLTLLKSEKTYDQSRFDLYAEYQGKKAFIEVKGVTLEEDGTARFPDAPTLRGLKHIQELQKCMTEGYEAWIFFVIQLKGVQRFQPNWKTQPEFGLELKKAAEAGVHVQAWDCQVKTGEIWIDSKIPVDFLTEMR
ncbi:MAG: DNA/RNA nuclease SfsA [Clostridia bacterium]|nr:DNA/RNA nuclease SfsA [Clostridia bacterium]NCC44839.1 DNA/RNA nuclease SfsA [Clostridia bacterium]